MSSVQPGQPLALVLNPTAQQLIFTVGSANREAVLLRGPGAHIYKALLAGGEKIERVLGNAARSVLDWGPEVATDRVRSFLGTGNECLGKLDELYRWRKDSAVVSKSQKSKSKQPDSVKKLEKLCKKVVEYTSGSQTPVTQLIAFRSIVLLSTRYVGLRWLFAEILTVRLQVAKLSQSHLSKLWREVTSGGEPDWEFFLEYAAYCVTAFDHVTLAVEECAPSQFGCCDPNKCVTESLSSSITIPHRANDLTRLAAVRYMGGILELATLWHRKMYNDPRSYDELICRKVHPPEDISVCKELHSDDDIRARCYNLHAFLDGMCKIGVFLLEDLSVDGRDADFLEDLLLLDIPGIEQLLSAFWERLQPALTMLPPDDDRTKESLRRVLEFGELLQNTRSKHLFPSASTTAHDLVRAITKPESPASSFVQSQTAPGTVGGDNNSVAADTSDGAVIQEPSLLQREPSRDASSRDDQSAVSADNPIVLSQEPLLQTGPPSVAEDPVIATSDLNIEGLNSDILTENDGVLLSDDAARNPPVYNHPSRADIQLNQQEQETLELSDRMTDEEWGKSTNVNDQLVREGLEDDTQNHRTFSPEERRERERELAWMATYIPSPTGADSLGQGAEDELDGIQAFTKEIATSDLNTAGLNYILAENDGVLLSDDAETNPLVYNHPSHADMQISSHASQLRQRDQQQQDLYKQYLTHSPASPPEASSNYGSQTVGVPDLSVIRVFAGHNLQTEATFKTVLLNSSTTSSDLIRQAMQRFRLPAGEDEDDYYLAVKQLEGSAAVLAASEHPLDVFETLVEDAIEIPKVKRSSVGSITSVASNLSFHPAIKKLPMNDFTDDSAVKFYLNKKADHSSSGSIMGEDGDETLMANTTADSVSSSSQYLSANNNPNNINADRFNSTSFRFALQLAIYAGDLPEDMVFDPLTEAIVFKNTLKDRALSNASASSKMSSTVRRKVFMFPKNVTVAEVIEVGLEQFGIAEGVVDGGDEVEDKMTKRRSSARVRYGLTVDIGIQERELSPSSKVVDAYPTPPVYREAERRLSETKRRSVDSAQLLGNYEDVNPEDPIFILRRAVSYRSSTSRHRLSAPLDELALSRMQMQRDSVSGSSVNSDSTADDAKPKQLSRQELIAAQRAASRANQKSVLSAQTNSVRGVDVLLPGNTMIRSSRYDAGAGDRMRYSYVEPDGEMYDISDIIGEEWRGNADANKNDLLESVLVRSKDGLGDNFDRVLNKIKDGKATRAQLGRGDIGLTL